MAEEGSDVDVVQPATVPGQPPAPPPDAGGQANAPAATQPVDNTIRAHPRHHVTDRHHGVEPILVRHTYVRVIAVEPAHVRGGPHPIPMQPLPPPPPPSLPPGEAPQPAMYAGPGQPQPPTYTAPGQPPPQMYPGQPPPPPLYMNQPYVVPPPQPFPPDAYIQQTYYVTPGDDPPDSSLCLSLFVCLCCSCLLGFIPLILSVLSRSARERGDFATARRYGQTARSLNLIIIALGAVMWVIMVVLYSNGTLGIARRT